MQITKIEGCTRTIGEAQGYYGLPLRDIIINDTVTGPETPAMESAWLPVPVELAAILSGAPITLRVVGRAHPPVMIYVDLDKSAPDGAALIAAERRRQIDTEGWTPEHDDRHSDGEMAVAAACYALEAGAHEDERDPSIPPENWPWAAGWWKAGDRIRELSKAGALIAAEIDRLKRMEDRHG